MQPPCAVGGVAEQKGAELNVDARLADELSTLGGQGLRQRLDVLLDERGQLAEISRARHGRERAPSRLRFARRRDGAVGVVDAARCDFVDAGFVLRIPDLPAVATDRIDPTAANKDLAAANAEIANGMYRHCRLTS